MYLIGPVRRNSSDFPRTSAMSSIDMPGQHPHEAVRLVVLFVEIAEGGAFELVADLVERVAFAGLQRAWRESAQALVDVRR